MKKILILFILILLGSFVFAHSEDAELNAELQKGKELIEKLQKGQITCQGLKNDDFHSIGEYAMEQIVGGSDHILMNQMMEKMHGEEAEELMHINMGKRYSGCNEGNIPRTSSIMLPMNTNMMNAPMMGYWWGGYNWRGWNILGSVFAIFGFLGVIIILTIPILILILLILSILYLIKKLRSENRKQRQD